MDLYLGAEHGADYVSSYVIYVGSRGQLDGRFRFPSLRLDVHTHRCSGTVLVEVPITVVPK